MNILLQREAPSGPWGQAVKSELFIDGSFFCFALERLGVEIPEGIYPVVMAWSEHFQEMIPHVNNVPGRSAIEIHYGNLPQDSKGCILVGYGEADGSISQSRQALGDLITYINDDGPVTIQVT